MMSDVDILLGYEAFFCIFVRASIEPKFVTVETDISAAWKWFRIHWFERKRCWK